MSLLNSVTIHDISRATCVMKSRVVGLNSTGESNFAPSMGMATEFLVMSSTQAQFAACELIALGGMMSLLQTPLTRHVLVVGSLLPRVYDLLYAILYILGSDVVHCLDTV
jgi:hypothetical protein